MPSTSSSPPSIATRRRRYPGAADRNFGVNGFDRVRVDGPYKVRLNTGVAPFATASGSAAALDSVAIDVQGRTLIVRTNRSTWGGYPGEATGPVAITIGTHELEAAWINGSGSLVIDKVPAVIRPSSGAAHPHRFAAGTSSMSRSQGPAA